MGAFKNDTQRGGPRGFGTQGMSDDSGDDYLALDRVDNPQQPRKAFANGQQSVVGAYTADGDSGMDKDPIAKPSQRIMQRILGDY
jgi:hypothetical protein